MITAFKSSASSTCYNIEYDCILYSIYMHTTFKTTYNCKVGHINQPYFRCRHNAALDRELKETFVWYNIKRFLLRNMEDGRIASVKSKSEHEPVTKANAI